MSIPPSVASILKEHVTLEIESIDRMLPSRKVSPEVQQYPSGMVGFGLQLQGYSAILCGHCNKAPAQSVAGLSRLSAIPGVPTFTWVGLSPTGDLRRWGGLDSK